MTFAQTDRLVPNPSDIRAYPLPYASTDPADVDAVARGRERRTADPFRDGVLAAVPLLRAFAFSLVGSRHHDRADDLVQETILKAWAHRSSFRPGTNLNAWLHTILRNEFYSQMRRKKREVEDADGAYANRLAVIPEQNGHLDMADMEAALDQLAEEQREAILLVAAAGFSYEDAAEICGVAVGTIKSRVNRARAKLVDILKVSGDTDYAPDSRHWAAISALGLQA
jgi:RNA polymerase sigma-70 factor (ECF subfamily)